MELITLIAKKVKEVAGVYKGFYKTVIYKGDNIMAEIPAYMRQPRKDKKTIVLNCFTYKLEWT